VDGVVGQGGMGHGVDRWNAVVRKAEVAAGASLLLAAAAIVFLLVGPVYQIATGSCSSGGSCVTSSGTAPLGWTSVLLVPLVAAGLVLVGVVLNRWTPLSLPVAGLGCLGLAVITFVGVFSIGMFLVPADVAAGVAVLCIRERRASA
jgi:hypothetical protein